MKIAVVRVRGIRNIDPKIKMTLELLRLEKPNHCVIIDDSPQNLGMLQVAKDYITFGPISEQTIESVLYKRGRKGATLLRSVLKEEEIKKAAKEISSGKKTIDYANPVFRLRPPSKGYKNVKAPYPSGELGKRSEIDSLIRRMI